MIYISDCVFCKHNRQDKIDGWIPSCDAFPDGMPLDFDTRNTRKLEYCNPENKIGFEEETYSNPVTQ